MNLSYMILTKLTSETVGGTSRLTKQETSELFHVDFTSLLDTDLEDIAVTLGTRSTFSKINLQMSKIVNIKNFNGKMEGFFFPYLKGSSLLFT